MCSRCLWHHTSDSRKFCKKKEINLDFPDIVFDYVVVDELWTYVDRKYVTEKDGKKRKSATGTAVWTIVAVKDNQRYVKAIAMDGHASGEQFYQLLHHLPRALEYHSDSASWYISAGVTIYQFLRLERGLSRPAAFRRIPTWYSVKSEYTNIVEGIHNMFRNKISVLKIKASGFAHSLEMLQKRLDLASMTAWIL